MSLLAISCPKLAAKDLEWIQSIRAEHDELHYSLVRPHVTLVFATEKIARREFVNHVRTVSEKEVVIPCVLRRAMVMKDHFGDNWYVLMVMAEGYGEIVKIHDRLYTGILADELRLDLPYIPHVTIGNSGDPQVCKALTDRLNTDNISIAGLVSSIDIITHENGRIETIEVVELSGKTSVDRS